jgi:hypothetical protein
MTGYRDLSIGAGKIFGGLQQMGIAGDVHIALEPEDGERLEASFSKQGNFSDMTRPDGIVLRTCSFNGVHFRWFKRANSQ